MTADKGGLSLTDFFRAVLRQFRTDLRRLLYWEISFKVLAAFILVPITALIGAYFISFTGSSSVSNERLVGYFTSPVGLVSVFLWGVSNLSIIFVEIAGLMTIAYSSLRGRSVSVSGTFSYALKHIPIVLGMGTVLVIVYAVACLPFLACAAGTYLWLLTDYDISFYLIERPPAFWAAVAIGVVLACGLCATTLYLATSWLFSLPASLYEALRPIEALRKSRALVKGCRFRIALILAIGTAIFVAVTTVATSIAGGAAWLAAYGLGALLNRPAFLGAIVLIANYLCTTLASVIAFPLLGILTARLYYDRHVALGLTPPDPPVRPHADVSEKRFHSGFVKIAPWIIFATIVAATGVVAMSVHNELAMEDRVEVTAHRGSSKKAPENSLSAITQAIEDGADYAEIDVQETADGVVVLLHDSDLMRIAGVNRKIWEVTYQEMSSFDTGSWFSPEFSGERIATLERAIATSKGRIKLNIELKYNGHDRKLAEEVVEIVRKNGFVNDCVITSLNKDGLRAVRGLDGSIKIGHIVAKSIGDILSQDVDVLSVESKLATADFIAKAHDREKEVHVWTVNEPRNMERFIDLRVNNIITDHPELLVQLLQERSRMSDMDRIIQKVESWIR